MKKIYSTIMMFAMMVAALSLSACSGKQKGNNNSNATEVITASGGIDNSEQDIKIIKEWYDYVIGTKDVTDSALNKYLSSDVKKQLWTEDYEGCYEFWQFRTAAQDCNPDGDISKIENITNEGDGWFTVTYKDMGWSGLTKIKVKNGKIVEFVPDKTWNSELSEVSEENKEISSSPEESYSNERLIFSNEQYIIGHLLNQRFRHSSGLEIRFDGDGRMYIDGDAAGVISVLRYDSESAILRYGNGMYGEGKLFMQYANGKIQLTDTSDGSVFYQK